MTLSVIQVYRDIYSPWLLTVHYARRIPSVSFAFGLFDGETCLGVVTFGTPASPQVQRSVAPDLVSQDVLELNRLVMSETAPKGSSASLLISKALKNLGPRVVISYADGKMGHNGYVYQACNFNFGGVYSLTILNIYTKEKSYIREV